MSDIPRQHLQHLLQEYGREICYQPKRFAPLLRGLCPDHSREINILLGAFREHVAEDLLAEESAPPNDDLFARLAHQVKTRLGISETLARWAVESWALALGVIAEGTRIDFSYRPAPPPVISRARVGEQEKTWWKNLDRTWQDLFKKSIGVRAELTDAILLKILNLEEVQCGDAHIQTLAPLSALAGLQSLDCHGAPIRSLGPLRQLKQLAVLDCHHTDIRTLAPLRDLRHLRKLVCQHTPIETLDSLRSLTRLETLACHETAISSLEPLHRLPNLRVVVCRDTRVSKADIEAFQRACPECVVIR